MGWQRPETVESMFVLWRMTKDPKYREWGWQIFEAFEKHTKVAHAGCGLRVARAHTRMRARTHARTRVRMHARRQMRMRARLDTRHHGRR